MVVRCAVLDRLPRSSFMNSNRRTARRAAGSVAAIAALVTAGCSPDPGGADSRPAGQSAGTTDSRLAELHAALDAGLLDAAATLLDQIGDSIGVEAPLLRARIVLLQGDAVASLRFIESAKQLASGDARVLATEIEIHVALDRLVGARELLRAAYKAAGRTPELERARGVLLIRTPGGGREGLTALETARELDPNLPFLGFPLAQAHHLVGREALGADAPDQALVHALLAREHDSLNLDYRELEAEARAGMGDFEGSLALYRELQADGRVLGETLAVMHKTWGTQLLLEQRREEALAQYCAARDLGLELGEFADALLADQAQARIDAGAVLAEDEDWSAASDRFRAALDLAPENVEAWNHLGVCLFREGDYYGAGEVWAEVLLIAARDELVLPEPVHLNLARAWRLAGESSRARSVLSAFLDQPDVESSPWVEETRDMLARLESDALEGG